MLALASMLIPDVALLPLLVLAGLMMIIGLRKLAGAIIGVVLLIAFSPLTEPLFDALFSAMPWWFVWVFLTAVLLSFRFVREVMVVVVGNVLSAAVIAVLVFPFRALAAIIRRTFGGWL